MGLAGIAALTLLFAYIASGAKPGPLAIVMGPAGALIIVGLLSLPSARATDSQPSDLELANSRPGLPTDEDQRTHSAESIDLPNSTRLRPATSEPDQPAASYRQSTERNLRDRTNSHARATHARNSSGLPLCGAKSTSPTFDNNPSCKRCLKSMSSHTSIAPTRTSRPTNNRGIKHGDATNKLPAQARPAHLSHSAVSTFNKCGKAFEFRYLKRETERFGTIEQHMGTCVHAALEETYKSAQRTGRHHDIDVIINNFNEAFDRARPHPMKIVRPSKGESYHRSTGHQCLKSYHARELTKSRPHEIIGIEQEIWVPDIVPGVALKGIIDLVLRTPDGTIEIVDFKTGTRVEFAAKSLQLMCYAHWAYITFEAHTVRCVFEDLRKSTRTQHTFVRSGKAGSSLEDLHAQIAKSFKAVLHASQFPASPSNLCAWCGFSPICDSALQSPIRRRSASRPTSGKKTVNKGRSKCPRCGGRLEIRQGANWGPLLGCTNFPDCRYYRNP